MIREFEGRLPSIEDGGESLRSPSTGERYAIYRQAAPHLFAAAARDALTRFGFAPQELTHVVTASCARFFAPGPNFILVKYLGVPRTAERIHIRFMGCAVALPALRSAARITCLSATLGSKNSWMIAPATHCARNEHYDALVS